MATISWVVAEWRRPASRSPGDHPASGYVSFGIATPAKAETSQSGGAAKVRAQSA